MNMIERNESTMNIAKITVTLLMLSLCSACDTEKGSEKGKDKAVLAMDASEYDEAVIFLKSHLTQGDDLEARYLLAYSYYMQGSYENAAIEFKKTSNKLEDIPTAYIRPMLKSYLESEDYLQLEVLTKQINRDSNSYFESKFYKAAMLLRTEERKAFEALIFSLSSELSDDDLYSNLLKVMKLLAEGNFVLAINKLEKLHDEKNINRDVLELLATTHMQVGNFERARRYYKLLSHDSPRDYESLLRYVLTSSYSTKISVVSPEIKELFTKFPNSPIVNLLYANEQFDKKKFEKAAKHAERAAHSNLGLPQAKLIAGLSNAYLGKDEIAYKYLSSIKGRLPNNHPALKLIAILELKLGYLPEDCPA